MEPEGPLGNYGWGLSMRMRGLWGVGAFLLAVAGAAGCVSVGKVEEAANHSGVYSYRRRVDPFTGAVSESVRCAFDVAARSWVFGTTLRPVAFTVRRSWTSDHAGAATTTLEVAYTGDDWRALGDIPRGQTLDILLDGSERIHLSGEGSRPGVGSATQNVYEVAVYPVTLGQLARLAGSGTARFRLEGDRGVETGLLEASSRKRIAGLLALAGR